MPINEELRHHLHELMVEVSLGLRDEEESYKRGLVWDARQKHNAAAVTKAYSDAAIHAFRNRVEKTVERYIEALNYCGIVIDDAVEKEMLQNVGSLTSASPHLSFPPAIKGEQAAAVQRAYSMEIARLGGRLYRDTANRLREAKFRAKWAPSAQVAAAVSKPNGDRKAMNLAEKDGASSKVFISYSWESQEHQDWVIAFATALRGAGVDVALDVWNLHHGDDTAIFMESSVADSDFVLVVCTPKYTEKANKRTGGVGYESMVITGQLAESIETNKFIPVLRQGTWASGQPIWLKTKLGADLTGSGNLEADPEFQRLLRTLHRQPLKAPPLGSRPSFADSPAQGTKKTGQEAHHPTALNLKEKELLWNAAQDKAGEILRSSTLAGEAIRTNGRHFIRKDSPRSEAEWNGALRSLEGRGLIEPRSEKRDLFSVTGAGYAVADRLESFTRWDADQVTLEARYINAHTESATFPCHGIVQIPAEYYADDIAADGSVMRSLAEPSALLIEGTDPKALDALNWNPTDASFVDAETGEILNFHVRRSATKQRGAIKLGIVSGIDPMEALRDE